MESLHRCQLCGSKNIALDVYHYTTVKVLYMVHCKSCGTALTRETSEQAIKDWNKKYKFTQKEIAELVGLSRLKINRLMNE